MKKVKILLSVTMLLSGYSVASEGGRPDDQVQEQLLAGAVASSDNSGATAVAGEEQEEGAVAQVGVDPELNDHQGPQVNGGSMQAVLDALARNASAPLPGQEVTGSKLVRAIWRGEGVPGTHPTGEGRTLTDAEIAEANAVQAARRAVGRPAAYAPTTTSYLGLPGAGHGRPPHRTGTLHRS